MEDRWFKEIVHQGTQFLITKGTGEDMYVQIEFRFEGSFYVCTQEYTNTMEMDGCFDQIDVDDCFNLIIGIRAGTIRGKHSDN